VFDAWSLAKIVRKVEFKLLHIKGAFSAIWRDRVQISPVVTVRQMKMETLLSHQFLPNRLRATEQSLQVLVLHVFGYERNSLSRSPAMQSLHAGPSTIICKVLSLQAVSFWQTPCLRCGSGHVR
jgi:hypothetical protein